MSESAEIRVTCIHCGGNPLKCRHVAFVIPWHRGGAETCKACGVNKVGTDPWGNVYCFACGEPGTTEDRVEGEYFGGSEALALSGDEPKDLVQAQERKRWTVYGLIDPRNRDFLYVGITTDPHKRLHQHRKDRRSAVYDRIQAIEAEGPLVEYCVFGIFSDIESAAFLEKNLIVSLPQTYNITYFNEGAEVWKRYREKKK